jgi:hypothetical protein
VFLSHIYFPSVIFLLFCRPNTVLVIEDGVDARAVAKSEATANADAAATAAGTAASDEVLATGGDADAAAAAATAASDAAREDFIANAPAVVITTKATCQLTAGSEYAKITGVRATLSDGTPSNCMPFQYGGSLDVSDAM